jgi:hypothetical protein
MSGAEGAISKTVFLSEEGIAVCARVDQLVRGQESGARGNEEGDANDAGRFDARSLKKLRDFLELPPNNRSFLYRTLSNFTRKNQPERATHHKDTDV